MNARDKLIKAVAEAACHGVVERTIAALQAQPSQISGDDSGLDNVWDELCVQVQEEESFFWEEYKETAQQYVEAELNALPRHDLEAIWLQTDAGRDWLFEADEAESRAAPKVPADAADAASYVFSTYLLPHAEEFSSPEIEAFLERAQKGRHELDEIPQDDSGSDAR